MIAADWGATFRLVALPWLATFSVFWARTYAADVMDGRAGLAVLSIPLFVAGIAIYLWVLVGWHRYVLLGERPQGVGPEWRGAQILSYFGWVVLIGIISAVPLAVLEWTLPFARSTSGSITTLYDAAIYVVWSYLSMRLSLVLPAAAVGARLSLGASWTKTGTIWPSILAMSAILSGMYMLLEAFGIAFAPSKMAELLQLAGHAAIGLLGVSVLTTLYGVLIEKRTL